MQHYRTVDNTMRPYPEIAANWAEAGITADKWVAFYCGTGWRASETWFYAYLMGWQTDRRLRRRLVRVERGPGQQPDRGRRAGGRIRRVELTASFNRVRGGRRFGGSLAALAWASRICLKTLPMPGRISSVWAASASRSRRRTRSASRGSRSSSLMRGWSG